MDSYFKFNEEDKKELMDIFFYYKEDPLYNKNLDVKCDLKIDKKDIGQGKILKYKANRETKQVKINIPKEIKNGQSIVLIKEGEKENNKYGNLIVTIYIK